MKDISKRRGLVVLFFAFLGPLISRSVGQIPAWELTYLEEVILFVSMAMALCTIFKGDEKVTQFVQLYRVAHERDRHRKIQRELDRLVPGWNWRIKGLKFGPQKRK